MRCPRFAAVLSASVAQTAATLAQPVYIEFADVSVGPNDIVITDQRTGATVQLQTAEITVRGRVLTIDGRHTISSLRLERGTADQPATLTHSPEFIHDYAGDGSDLVRGMDLTVVGDCSVEGASGDLPESAIDLAGRGHPAGFGPGAGQGGGYGVSSGGAGHGGAGGDGYSLVGGGCYGSYSSPATFGSGGGEDADQYWSRGRAGGGAAILRVGGALVVDGRISADAQSDGGSCYHAAGGGGAGGSLQIIAESLSGAGAITARGSAAPCDNGGGGGGGRVALTLTSNSFAGQVLAHGSPGFYAGGAGTIWIDDLGGARPVLIVDNGGLFGEATEIEGDFQVAGDLLVDAGANLVHAPGSGGLHIQVAGDARIGPQGLIAADGRGFAPGEGPGAGSGGGYGYHSGGGAHGGAGGNGFGDENGGETYGSYVQPTELGSGGGEDAGQQWSHGTAGGGAVRLSVAGELAVDGRIGADAQSEGGSCWRGSGGGGSGGSIWISAVRLTGSGMITARGAAAPCDTGGGGGGGRVSLTYDTSNFSGEITAHGGGGNEGGGAGTVWIDDRSGLKPVLVLDNGGLVGAATESSGELVIPGDLVIDNGANLTHPPLDAGFHVRVVGDVVVGPAGLMSADGRGFPGGSGPGAGEGGGYGYHGGGGGHGGVGGRGYNLGGGVVNGSATAPMQFGSGGGEDADRYWSRARGGGGAMRLTVTGGLVVSGRISADAQHDGGSCWRSSGGGGAGGSIWITASQLSGSGEITARGSGAPCDTGGGGGGGRVAVYACLDPVSPAFQLQGGGGFQSGQEGSLVLGADLNGDGSVDSRDVVTFLNAWSQRDPSADFNGDGVVDSKDVVAFLNAWVVGC